MCKELCDCGNIATWIYMPGYIEGGNPYSCDNCVHRGCSCNYHYIDDTDTDNPIGTEGKDFKWINNTTWTYIDNETREYPCVEYCWSKDGFEIDED